MQNLSDQMNRLVAGLEMHLKPLSTFLQAVAQQLQPMIQGIVFYDQIAKSKEATGWLPYRTVPFAEFLRTCGADAAAFSAKVNEYYETYSSTITEDIASQIESYDVDDEAKETLREALRAHSCGLFRCVCRVLLPEMERVIQADWRGVQGIQTLNQRTLETEINKYALSDFAPNGPHDLVIFGLFANHLFTWVQNRSQVDQETLPNRHAATHGWASYSSRQSSLNTIICADYIFRLTTNIKAANEEKLNDHHVAQP